MLFWKRSVAAAFTCMVVAATPALAQRVSAPVPQAEPVVQRGAELRPQSNRRSRSIDIDFERLTDRGLLTPNAAQSRLANELRVIKRPLINNCVGKGGATVCICA